MNDRVQNSFGGKIKIELVLSMTIRPKYSLGETRPLATRQFTDREEFIQVFQDAVRANTRKEHRVLMYYGIGGIGKTSLRKELVKFLEENKTGSVWVVLDFEVASFRDQETALFVVRKSLQERYKIQFPTFDLAYAVYWKKTRPQIPMHKENFPLLGDDGVVANIISIIGTASGVPIISLIPNASKIIMKGQRFIREWWAKRGMKELSKLDQLEPKQIAERLPMYWAVDLKDHLQQITSSAIFFIDSYEALWEGVRSEVKVFEQDEWMRELISQLPEILWVICGRERLRWEEYNADWGKHLTQHLVGGLADEDSKRFLRSCGIVDETIQEVIVKGSKGVPYYLDLAVDTYFEIKNQHDREPLAADFAKKPKEILVRLLRYLDTSEIETIKVLSVPRFWNYSLFEQLVTEFKTGYAITAFSELCRFSFINEGALVNTWSMHQLMRESLKEHLDPNLLKSVHRFLFNHYGDELKEIDIKNITDKHKNTFTEAVYHGKFSLEGIEFFNWFREVANVFDKAAQWKLLIPLYEEITGILEKALGPDHPDIAASLNNVAVIYWNLGKYSEAESLHKRTLEIREKALGLDHPDVAQSLNNLANLHREQGKYTDAEQLYARALAIREKALGPDHPDVAQSLNNLAILYRAQGKYAQAEPLYKQALKIFEKILGPYHPDVASSLNNLAVIYWNQGKYAEAESLHKRTLEIREKALGPDHPNIAVSLGNLGCLYDEQRRHAEAEPLHQRALGIMEKVFGQDHPHIATLLNNLANCYRGQGKYAEAEPLYKRASQIFENALGPDHPNIALSLNNLAKLYWNQNKYAEAEPLIKRALATLEKTLGLGHPNLARSLNNLANCYRDQGKSAEAELLYKRALGILEKALGPDHPDVKTLLEDMAKLYRKITKDDEAQMLEERVKRIRSKMR